MAVADGAGVEFAWVEGDGLVVEVEIAGLGAVACGFFPSLRWVGSSPGGKVWRQVASSQA